jgi:hypothetical protein
MPSLDGASYVPSHTDPRSSHVRQYRHPPTDRRAHRNKGTQFHRQAVAGAPLWGGRRRHRHHRVGVRAIHAPDGRALRENERYPFGDAERTWQVTVGFDWIAYAILFAVAGVAVRRVGGRRLWALMGLSFAILWFPHLAIGVAMALDGS